MLGLTIALVPGRPRDVATARPAPPLPSHLGAGIGLPVPLDPVEQRYYARHGGQAEKRLYRSADGHSTHVLRVRTNAPLRHLHDPADCLRGAGHAVTRYGVTPGQEPSVVFRSVDPEGRAWRIEAAFVSDRNERASGVSEVLWRWLSEPAVAWSLIERITPWSDCEIDAGRCRAFDAALFRALDLPSRVDSASTARTGLAPLRSIEPVRPGDPA